jgi:putative transposase
MKDLLNWQTISRQGAHQGIARIHKAQRDLLDTIELAGSIHSERP